MTDDIYRERARLVAFLAASYPSHSSFSDPAEPDWLVVTVETSQGQMSWHVAPDDQELFNHVRRTRPADRAWDQHTTPEKYERLARLTRDVYAVRIRSDVSRETSADESLGSIAFEAYAEQVGNLTHDGGTIPGWVMLSSEVREGWQAAARAVLDVSRETSTRGETHG